MDKTRPRTRPITRPALFSTLLLLLSNTNSAIWAAEPLFSTFLESGQKEIKACHYDQAEKQLEMALANSEHLSETAEGRMKLYCELGAAYCYTGKFEKSREYLEKVVQYRKSKVVLGKKQTLEAQLSLYEPVCMLGTVYRNMDRFADSERLYKESLNVFQGNNSLNLLCQATVLYALGTLYLEMQKPKEAETILKAALSTREKTAQKKYLSENGIYDALGRSYYLQDRLSEAEETLKKALEFAREEKSATSEAYTKANLSLVYGALGKYEEARKLLKESLETISKSHGEGSNQMATCYSTLAKVAIEQDQYDEAEELLSKALQTHRKLLGEDHTFTARDLMRLSTLMKNQGRYGEAEEYAQKSLSVYEKLLGSDNEGTNQARRDLAQIIAESGTKQPEKLNQAIELLSKAASSGSIVDKALNDLTLGEVQIRKGQKKEAEQSIKNAVAMLDGSGDETRLPLYKCTTALADFYLSQGREQDAEIYADKALKLKRQMLASDASDQARLVVDLRKAADIKMRLGKGNEYQNLSAEIKSIVEASPQMKDAVSIRKFERQENSQSVKQRPVKNKWALVIGISNFKESDINLRFAAKDAIDFSNYLVNDAGFSPTNVKLLTDKNATRDNIIKELGDGFLGRKAGLDDLVVIYVSSHGSTSMENADGVNFLVAHDTNPQALLSTGIPMQWLSQIIKEQVHSDRVILIMDVCHSGAASSGAKGLSREKFNTDKIAVGAGQAIICSSAPEQVSWESKNYQNSVFTRKLIEALKRPGSNLDTAYDYLKEQVYAEVMQDRHKVQTPLYFSRAWQGPPPVLAVPVNAGAEAGAKANPSNNEKPGIKKAGSVKAGSARKR